MTEHTDALTEARVLQVAGDPLRWFALPVLLTGAFLPILDFNVVNLALPAIRQGLGATSSEVQFVISAYAASYAVFLITGGRLGDWLGRTPGDVRFVILSHLHSDHSGAIGRFPKATHVVQRREYAYAFAPDWFAAGAYARKDFDRSGLSWQFLDGEATDGHDLYGDGVLRMVFTPGHTVGHQSFLITLPDTGTILLAADAVYTMDHWHEKALPGFMASAVDAVRSVQKLRVLAERERAMVVTGHDPEAWPGFRLAPEFYA